MISWDDTFFEVCEVVAKRSKDTSTKFGCVIVGPDREIRSTGYNSFPRGINDNDPARFERPYKYHFFEHAERNAFYNAARMGTSTKGCTMYIAGLPCSGCARSIIQCGIKEVVVKSILVPERWLETCQAGLQMMLEAGVGVRRINQTIYLPADAWKSVGVDNEAWGSSAT